MYCAKIVALVSMLVAGSQGFRLLLAPIVSAQQAVSGGLGLANSGVQLGASVGSQGYFPDSAKAKADLGKQVILSEQNIGSNVIKGSANLANQGLDVMRNATAPFPVIGSIGSVSADVGSAGVAAASSLAQDALATGNAVADSVIDRTNSAGQKVITKVSNGSNMVFGTATNMSNAFFDGILGLFPTEAASTETSTEASTEASSEAATEASTSAATEASTSAATEASTEAATEATATTAAPAESVSLA